MYREVNIKSDTAMSTATEPARPRCLPPWDVMHESAQNLWRPLDGLISTNKVLAIEKDCFCFDEIQSGAFIKGVPKHCALWFVEVYSACFRSG